MAKQRFAPNPEGVQAGAFLQWAPGGMRHGAQAVGVQPAAPRRMYGGSLGLACSSTQEIVARLRAGLPVAAFEHLRQALDVSTSALAATTNIAARTLARRKQEGHLRKDESERVLRIGTLLDHAIEVLEDRDTARQWLKSPKRALDGRTPLEYADTEPGAREVENLLIRLEYGVFS